MNYILDKGAQPVYPYTISMLRQDNPNIGISVDPTPHDLATFSVYSVNNVPPPEVDLRTHRVDEAPLPTRRSDGSWEQAWVVRDATPEEASAYAAANAPQPDWLAFGVALATSPAIAALYAAVPGPMGDGLSIGLSKAGDGDPRLFLSFWAQLLAAGVITPELLGVMGALAQQFNLPQTFVNALSGGEP